MTTQVDKERRDQLLDDLKAALDEWAEAEEQRIEDEVAFVKSVLRGRTGSERLARANTREAEVLVVDDITSFLAGTS
jgi:hypothetical protein